MVAKDLISDVVSPLFTSDTGNTALSWMEIHKISHLPIVNNKQFLGLISESDIFDLNSPDTPIGDHKLSLFSPYVFDDDHIYTVIALVNKLKLTIIPVLDHENNYLGVITLQDLVHHFSDLINAKQPGGIIILEMNVHDYSLSQISQIVEGNDAKIMSVYLHTDPSTTKLDVIIKVNVIDLSAIIQTFIRYEYIIKASYQEESEMNNLYKNRYESFLRYLNI
ncbi:MAG: CBS domain-containing protein [Bacteroidales bacterium]|nr:CBS domain-containing protein [Bacteroidales bacterium]